MAITKNIEQPPLNNWQILANATNGIVSPANLMDATVFAPSLISCNYLDTWGGIAVAGVCIAEDGVNGIVARRTKTPSDLGEKVDAITDKIKLGYALYKIHQKGLAPKSLTEAVAIQNIANTVLTGVDRAINDKPVIHPSQFGKKAILLQQLGLGLHTIGSKVAETNPSKARTLKGIGSVIGFTGVGVGIIATGDYAKTLIESRLDTA